MKKVLIFLFTIFIVVCTFGLSACTLIGGQEDTTPTETKKEEKKTTYLLTVFDGIGGGEFEAGTQVTVIADVKDGMIFIGWSEDGTDIVSNEFTYTFVLRGNVTLFAMYEEEAVTIIEYQVDVKADGVNADTYVVENGDSISLIAQNKTGYVFEKWVDSNGLFISSKSVVNYYPTKDIVIIAKFKKTYAVNVLNGTVNGQSTNNQYPEGTKLTISANQIAGKYFVGWYIDDTLVSQDNPYILEVTGDTIVSAEFEEIEAEKTYYTIVIYADGVTPTTTTIEDNKQFELKANVPNGYRFVKWVDNNNTTISTTVNKTLRAERDEVYKAILIKQCDVSVTGGSGSGTYDSGTSVTVTADVPKGYDFVSWKDSTGKVLSNSATYTFNVLEDITLVVELVHNEWTEILP